MLLPSVTFVLEDDVQDLMIWVVLIGCNRKIKRGGACMLLHMIFCDYLYKKRRRCFEHPENKDSFGITALDETLLTD
jgi:hypothetical protein